MNATILTLVVLTTCLVAVSIRRMEGSWFSPASLLSLIWSVVIVFSVISAPDYYFSVKGLLYILFNLILFFTGGKLYEYFSGRIQSIDISESATAIKVNSGLYVFAGIVSGIIAVILLVHQSGNSIMTVFDINKLMTVSKELTTDRYNGVRLSSMIMLCLTITYFSSFYAGMDLAIRPGWSSRIRLIILMLPVVIFTLIYTARAVMLFMIFILISSYITFLPFNRKKKLILFNKFNVIAVVGGFILLVAVFFFAQAARLLMRTRKKVMSS